MVRISVTPTPTPAISQVGEPTWYFLWDATVNTVIAFGTLAALGVAIWVAGQPARERIRAQASRVTFVRLGILDRDEPRVLLECHNGSDLPIFGAYIHDHESGFGRLTVTGIIRAGETVTHEVPHTRRPLVVDFRDANGLQWKRSMSGALRRGAMPRWIESMRAVIRRNHPTTWKGRAKWKQFLRERPVQIHERRRKGTGEHRSRYTPPEPEPLASSRVNRRLLHVRRRPTN